MTKVLLNAGTGEITEKKSRFIAYLKGCETEGEALAFIAGIKKKHYDARHNCHAFIVGEEPSIIRSNDDGEPSGTAGRPILEVLTGYGLHNVCAVVTRYFGGTLLGTGGLVRAYSDAVREALKNSELGLLIPGKKLLLRTGYAQLDKVLSVLSSFDVSPTAADYGEDVVLSLTLPADSFDSILKNITDATGGNFSATAPTDTYYTKVLNDKDRS
ncbi:MAG: YigZ family protein [Lachnospiraceae bacterium]|nr:YigZ family protein [Lachnospiraceae bacterium]